ncbi:MAG: hypothetical protein ACRD4D_04990 [Candidatus Acidiferrales bacterium]
MKRLSQQLKRRMLEAFAEAIEKRDREIFERAIREAGLQPGMPEYARALMKWQEHFRGGSQ